MKKGGRKRMGRGTESRGGGGGRKRGRMGRGVGGKRGGKEGMVEGREEEVEDLFLLTMPNRVASELSGVTASCTSLLGASGWTGLKGLTGLTGCTRFTGGVVFSVAPLRDMPEKIPDSSEFWGDTYTIKFDLIKAPSS